MITIMKYTPKALHENVNVSHSSALRELLLLLTGILGILVFVYVALGLSLIHISEPTRPY